VGHPDLRRRRHDQRPAGEVEEGGGDVGDMVKRGGIGGFLYLEVLDASFSFDGVIGAFAITNDVVIIMLGLAIGAMFVRSLTVYLVEEGHARPVRLPGARRALRDRHPGADHAGEYEVPRARAGDRPGGVAFIGASVWSSIRYRKRMEARYRVDHQERTGASAE
jgi:hypothetical protein